MLKRLFFCAALLTGLCSHAITYQYDNLNKSALTCRLKSWGGQQPSSGKLVLKETYEEGGKTYKVTAIAPHALDNLTEVTEITIPANVTAIGDNVGGTIYATSNFFNCPKLATFKVASGNTVFAASGAGVLMYDHGTTVARIPAALAVSGGTVYKMSKSVTTICADAFAGNTTITGVALSTGLVNLLGDGGFSDMKDLREFSFNGTPGQTNFAVKDGVLYDAAMKELVMFPPSKTAYNFTVPFTVKTIRDKAFRNSALLYDLNLNQVAAIGRESFAFSGVTNLKIPSGVSSIGKGAFMGLTRLQQMTIDARLALPEDFARDCARLESVDCTDGAISLGAHAFKGCPSLRSFPFKADTSYGADSIFSGCGFHDVVFQEGVMPMEGLRLGTAMFQGNKELRQIDMSRLSPVPGGGKGCEIPLFFLADCPRLYAVVFPSSAGFWGSTEGLRSSFGTNSPVEYIMLGAFTLSGSPAIVYDNGHHTPTVYMLTTDIPDSAKSWPLESFFHTSGGATCRPSVYCEGYTMRHAGSDNEYVIPGANYFVPGRTAGNYSAVTERGGHLTEMYDCRSSVTDGTLTLKFSDRIDGLVFTDVILNDDISAGVPDNNGILATGMSYNNVRNITVRYNLRGVGMKTVYSEPADLSGADRIDADPALSSAEISVTGRKAMFGTVADYAVVSPAGTLLLSGNAPEADLSVLPAGIYIITVRDNEGYTTTSKISLR